MERGTTLLGLVAGLAVLGLVLAAALPRVGQAMDRWACIAAREALVTRAEKARTLATQVGSARLVVDADSAHAWVESGGLVADPIDLQARYGVRFTRPSGTRAVALAFDRLGIGRFANRTFEIARGSAQATLTVSSYGRLRR